MEERKIMLNYKMWEWGKKELPEWIIEICEPYVRKWFEDDCEIEFVRVKKPQIEIGVVNSSTSLDSCKGYIKVIQNATVEGPIDEFRYDYPASYWRKDYYLITFQNKGIIFKKRRCLDGEVIWVYYYEE